MNFCKCQNDMKTVNFLTNRWYVYNSNRSFLMSRTTMMMMR